jgi:hypothetical protein
MRKHCYICTKLNVMFRFITALNSQQNSQLGLGDRGFEESNQTLQAWLCSRHNTLCNRIDSAFRIDLEGVARSLFKSRSVVCILELSVHRAAQLCLQRGVQASLPSYPSGHNVRLCISCISVQPPEVSSPWENHAAGVSFLQEALACQLR